MKICVTAGMLEAPLQPSKSKAGDSTVHTWLADCELGSQSEKAHVGGQSDFFMLRSTRNEPACAIKVVKRSRGALRRLKDHPLRDAVYALLEVTRSNGLQLRSMQSARGLFCLRRLGTQLLQSYAGPAAVLVDELDT